LQRGADQNLCGRLCLCAETLTVKRGGVQWPERADSGQIGFVVADASRNFVFDLDAQMAALPDRGDAYHPASIHPISTTGLYKLRASLYLTKLLGYPFKQRGLETH